MDKAMITFLIKDLTVETSRTRKWFWHLTPSSLHKHNKRKWFSGKIQRCHRWAPGSIPGLRSLSEIV